MAILPDIEMAGGLTCKLLFAAFIAAFGAAFQHGYSIGVVNAPQKVICTWVADTYSERLNLTGNDKLNDESVSVTTLWSVAVSIYCIGGVIGALTSSVIAYHIGRRNGLWMSNIFAIISGLLMGFSKMAKLPELIVIGRFIHGYNCGLNSGLCGMYLVEISPKALRGTIGSFYQLILVIAISFAQIVGLRKILGNEEGWPIILGFVQIVVAVIQMLLLPFCPESPKCLFVKKGEEKTKKTLIWLRGTDDVGGELSELQTELQKENETGKATCGQMMSKRILRVPLMYSIVIMLAQQLSGINAVMYYSTSSFNKAGITEENAQYATIGMGLMNVFMTVVSMFLVDITGRKTLLLLGFGLMCIDTILLTVSFKLLETNEDLAGLCIAFVILFVVCFAIGPGSIPWFLISEFFTQDARPLAASIAVAVNWFANTLVGLSFLYIQQYIGTYVFLIFVFFLAFFTVIIFCCIPETKNKTYEEISAKF